MISKRVGETKPLSVNMDGHLDSGETMTGAVTVTEYTRASDGTITASSGLTISSAAVNAGTKLIDGKTVAASKSLTMRVAGGTAGKTYLLVISVGTSDSNTVLEAVLLAVVSNTAHALTT